jgi:putative PIG3 family NAD(P)H quinone oxidoreductase
MPAIVVRQTGGQGHWNELVLEEVERPQAASGEVLVQVEACSVNRADLLQRRGLYPPPPGSSPLLGLDFAGFVVQAAPDVVSWHAGDRVFGVVAGGGYGRYVRVPAGQLLPVPDNLSFVEAAAVAEVFLVAWLNLFGEGGLEAAMVCLIQGGSGGVGTAAVQLAREAGARIIVTAGERSKLERCLGLGAHHGIHYREEDFFKRVLEITAGEGVHLVLDCVGAPYLGHHLQLLRNRGRLVLIGLMGGHHSEIDLAPVLTKRLRIVGSVLRSRTAEEKAALTRDFHERVLPWLQTRRVRPIVDRLYPIEAVEEAHAHMRSGSHFGKIVLSWHTARHHG